MGGNPSNRGHSEPIRECLLVQTQRIQESGQLISSRRRLSRLGKVGKPNQPIAAKCIQGPVRQDTNPLSLAKLQDRFLGITFDQSTAAFVEIHRQLNDTEVMVGRNLFSFCQAALDAGLFGL